jgi:photosystem II stability/assembly factor-like uncharacterized protein
MSSWLRCEIAAGGLILLASACSTNSSAYAPGRAPTGLARQHTTVRHVAGRLPVQGRSMELAADRQIEPANRSATIAVSPKANRWRLQATLPGAVIHDISFPTRSVGYAAAELGQIWKTADGGSTWTEIMNLGFPYYWFGVKALDAADVVIAGFNDSTFQGVIRWSHDGGATWTQDIVLTTTGWSYRVRFANAKRGLVMDGVSTVAPNAAHYTTDGGATAADWTSVVPDPNGGWFGNQFSLLPDLHARASGITYCSSKNGGAVWSCGPSIDSVFDGPVFFANDRSGWVGGGEISPSVAGWVHRTADGGKTWSGRTLQSPFPIRELRFITPDVGWAAGGNIYSNVGGIYFSSDMGQTWTLDLNTSGHEMDACDSRKTPRGYRVWCAGYDSSLNGAVYTTIYRAAQ